MKVIFEKTIGGDGAKVGLYLEEGMIVEKVSYPLAKVLTPFEGVVKSAIGKIEKLIPGDQTAIADGLEKDAMAAIVKLLSE